MAIRPPTGRHPGQIGDAQEIRSQVALELLLNGYAAGAALIMLRTLLLALGVDQHLWIGRTIYGPSRLLIMPFKIVPGSGLEVVGHLTLADATVFAAVILFPLGMLMLGERRKRRPVRRPLASH
jgi:hypothetical protein